MKTLEFAMDRKRLWLGTVCAAFLLVLFTALAIGVLVVPGSRGSTIGILVFCAFVDLFAVWGLRANVAKLRDRTPQLLLDAEGVTDRTLPTAKIP